MSVIEVVRDTEILVDYDKASDDKDASRNLGTMIRCHNQKIFLASNNYQYNPHLSYREKVALADRVMYCVWRGLCDSGYPAIANGLAKMGQK